MEKLKMGIHTVLLTIAGTDGFTLVKSVVAVVGGVVVSLLGGADPLLKWMAWAVGLDYLMGVLKAIMQRQLSSTIGARGIAKKVMYFVVVGFAVLVEQATNGVFPLREMTIMFYLCNEGISIFENLADVGVPFPEKIKEVLVQLKGKGEKGSQ